VSGRPATPRVHSTRRTGSTASGSAIRRPRAGSVADHSAW
jgi:hypothetical protein